MIDYSEPDWFVAENERWAKERAKIIEETVMIREGLILKNIETEALEKMKEQIESELESRNQ